MNSHSSWICRDEQMLSHRPETDQSAFEDKKRDCLVRIRQVEADLKTVDLPAKLKSVAFRRMETAKRFFRSDELGGCNYELHILELLINQLKGASGKS